MVLVLCICITSYLNIISYLWVSLLVLVGFYLNLRIVVALLFTLIFSQYLSNLEFNYLLGVRRKFFYYMLLILVLELFLNQFLIFLFFFLYLISSVLSYLAVGGIYFFSWSLFGGRSFFVFLLCLVYLFSFHEFCIFSLVLGFPLAFIFYYKVSLVASRCFYFLLMFLIPLSWGMNSSLLRYNENGLTRLFFLFLL